MNMVRNVDTSIPPTTAVPIAMRWLAPSPVANAKGISPNTVAALVIRMGNKSQYRSRTGHQDGAQALEGSIADGLHLVLACLLFLVGKLHNQNAVLRHQPDEHDDANLAEDVHGDIPEIHEYQCAGNGKWHGEHDDERVFKAFELRRKDEVNQRQRQDKGKHQA